MNDMIDYKRTELLVNIARLYYENEYSQEEIAQTLGLSRPYISKLLNECKKAGIVRFQIIDPLSTETFLEKKFRERFHLKKACIVSLPDGTVSLERLGLEAARYLDSIIKDGDVIGYSWGSTIFSFSKSLIPRNNLKNIVAVQLCGGVSSLNKNIFSAEIATNFSTAFDAASFVLPLPAVMDSKETKKLLQNEHSISKILQYGFDSNIALFTTGAFGQNSALVHTGYITPDKMQSLSDKGVVGDVCSHFIDIHGNICDPELDERTFSLPLDELKKKEYRICVAQGFSKADSILGALNGGLINVLITSEETAKWILSQDEYMNA